MSPSRRFCVSSVSFSSFEGADPNAAAPTPSAAPPPMRSGLGMAASVFPMPPNTCVICGPCWAAIISGLMPPTADVNTSLSW